MKKKSNPLKNILKPKPIKPIKPLGNIQNQKELLKSPLYMQLPKP